jgi:hypothetical protein
MLLCCTEEMPIEKYVQLVGEKIVDIEYNMIELLDLAWRGEIHLGLDLNEEPTEGNKLNNQPTPIVKLPHTREYAQLLSNFAMQHPMKF